jgi:hypothetical protein
MPDSGSSAGIASLQTDSMCDMRRSLNDLDDLAAIMLVNDDEDMHECDAT